MVTIKASPRSRIKKSTERQYPILNSDVAIIYDLMAALIAGTLMPNLDESFAYYAENLGASGIELLKQPAHKLVAPMMERSIELMESKSLDSEKDRALKHDDILSGLSRIKKLLDGVTMSESNTNLASNLDALFADQKAMVRASQFDVLRSLDPAVRRHLFLFSLKEFADGSYSDEFLCRGSFGINADFPLLIDAASLVSAMFAFSGGLIAYDKSQFLVSENFKPETMEYQSLDQLLCTIGYMVEFDRLALPQLLRLATSCASTFGQALSESERDLGHYTRWTEILRIRHGDSLCAIHLGIADYNRTSKSILSASDLVAYESRLNKIRASSTTHDKALLVLDLKFDANEALIEYKHLGITSITLEEEAIRKASTVIHSGIEIGNSSCAQKKLVSYAREDAILAEDSLVPKIPVQRTILVLPVSAGDVYIASDPVAALALVDTLVLQAVDGDISQLAVVQRIAKRQAALDAKLEQRRELLNRIRALDPDIFSIQQEIDALKNGYQAAATWYKAIKSSNLPFDNIKTQDDGSYIIDTGKLYAENISDDKHMVRVYAGRYLIHINPSLFSVDIVNLEAPLACKLLPVSTFASKKACAERVIRPQPAFHPHVNPNDPTEPCFGSFTLTLGSTENDVLEFYKSLILFLTSFDIGDGYASKMYECFTNEDNRVVGKPVKIISGESDNSDDDTHDYQYIYNSVVIVDFKYNMQQYKSVSINMKMAKLLNRTSSTKMVEYHDLLQHKARLEAEAAIKATNKAKRVKK